MIGVELQIANTPANKQLSAKRNTLTHAENIKKEKLTVFWVSVCLSLFYGMDLLYSFPSSASLYISATYGFFAGVSAPNSTRRAYTLTT